MYFRSKTALSLRSAPRYWSFLGFVCLFVCFWFAPISLFPSTVDCDATTNTHRHQLRARIQKDQFSRFILGTASSSSSYLSSSLSSSSILMLYKTSFGSVRGLCLLGRDWPMAALIQFDEETKGRGGGQGDETRKQEKVRTTTRMRN